MKIRQSGDPLLRLGSMKIKLEIPKKVAPSRSLPRSASEIADPPSPFSSNPAHHPVSVPVTPAAAPGLSSSASFGCMAATPTTGSPPATPGKAKPKPATTAAFYAAQWSPRRLMQRAARVFRTSRSRRVRAKDAGEERAASVTAKVSDEAGAVAVDGGAAEIVGSDGHGGTAASLQAEEQRHDHPEVVPEKIIHVANHHAPPPVVAKDECGTKTTTPAEEKETTTADAEVVESPKKGAALVNPAPPEPEAVPASTEDVADKFVTVVKEAIKKHEAEQDEKKEAMRMFQGSRVKTAMEARPDSEQPRRREVARSKDVIEEARSKLLEKRQLSKVRALVGAFETVMDSNKDAAGKRQHRSRKSA